MALDTTYATLVGEKSPTFLNSTSGTISGNWQTLYVVNDAVINSLNSNAKNQNFVTGVTILAGTLLPMTIYSVGVSSGLIMLMSNK